MQDKEGDDIASVYGVWDVDYDGKVKLEWGAITSLLYGKGKYRIPGPGLDASCVRPHREEVEAMR